MSNEIVLKHNVKSLLESEAYRGRLTTLLGNRAPQFVTSLIQISQTYQLEKCEPGSVIAAGMIAASLDLPINPQLGFAYIIPYGTTASFQMGYKGYVQLAMRSGLYKRLNVTEVYEGELLKYDRVRADVVIDHDKKKSDKVVGYIAYFELTNGAEHAEYWPVEAVLRHAERYSQAYRAKKKDSPWFTDPDKMGRKTVLKSLLVHWGPLSVQMQDAVVSDMTDDSLALPDAPVAKDVKVRKTKKQEESPAPMPESGSAPTEPAGTVSGAGATTSPPEPERDVATRLLDEGVPYDDFVDFMVNQGYKRDLRDIATGYDNVPSVVWESLGKMPYVMSKIIKTYGTRKA